MFHPLQIVVHGIETQLEVAEKINYITRFETRFDISVSRVKMAISHVCIEICNNTIQASMVEMAISHSCIKLCNKTIHTSKVKNEH